jgi:hypothetical protein
MKIDIDQSWRIEYTNKKTVLADSKGNSVVISAKDKRDLQKLFREAGRSRMFVYEVFSALLSILISLSWNEKAKDTYIIDLEYPGWSDQIKDFVLRFARRLGVRLAADQINFDTIGKKSKAHQGAYEVFKDWKKPAKVANLNEILQLILA